MPAATPYKICPRCQTQAALDAPSCTNCGRVYNTKFSLPAVSDEKPVVSVARKKRHPILIAGITLCAIAAIVLGGKAVAVRLRIAPISVANDPRHPFLLYPHTEIATQNEDDLGTWSQALPVVALGGGERAHSFDREGDNYTQDRLTGTGRIVVAEGLDKVEVEGESRAHPGVYWVKVVGPGVNQGVTGWVGGWAITQAGKDGAEAFPFAAKNQMVNGALPYEALRQR